MGDLAQLIQEKYIEDLRNVHMDCCAVVNEPY